MTEKPPPKPPPVQPGPWWTRRPAHLPPGRIRWLVFILIWSSHSRIRLVPPLLLSSNRYAGAGWKFRPGLRRWRDYRVGDGRRPIQRAWNARVPAGSGGVDRSGRTAFAGDARDDLPYLLRPHGWARSGHWSGRTDRIPRRGFAEPGRESFSGSTRSSAEFSDRARAPELYRWHVTSSPGPRGRGERGPSLLPSLGTRPSRHGARDHAKRAGRGGGRGRQHDQSTARQEPLPFAAKPLWKFHEALLAVMSGLDTQEQILSST